MPTTDVGDVVHLDGVSLGCHIPAQEHDSDQDPLKIHTFNCRNCVSAVLYSHLRSSVKNLRAIASSFALMSFIIAVIGGSLHSISENITAY